MVDLKAKIRRERLAIRDAIPAGARAEKSAALCAHGEAGLAFSTGTVVSGFLPIRSEADIRPLMEGLSARGAISCVPVILDRETIVFRALSAGAPLVSGSFGTLEPGPDAPELEPEILLVPLSAFDGRGRRIGYGGGYYDRAIARLRQKGLATRVIGIAFDCQEMPSVPAEPHDIPLDGVLTESGLRMILPKIG